MHSRNISSLKAYFRLTVSAVVLSLSAFSQANQTNQVSHAAIADALLKKYGSIENILINMRELEVYEQNAIQTYITDLEYSKLQSNYQNRDRLEILRAENKKNDIIKSEKMNSDPAFIERMRKIERQRLIAENKLLVRPPESLIDTIKFDPSLPQELILQVYPGFPGSISFFDQTGAPWPIVYVKLGAQGAFEAGKTPGNAYSLEARLPGVTHSGWFQLKGLDTTIPFMISSEKTDYYNSRRQVIIPLIGPNAKPIQYRSTSSVDLDKAGPEFFSFLSGTTTGVPGAKETKLQGINGQAYLYNEFVYIRTTAILRSKGSSLVREGSVGDYNLYKLYPRSFYWFSDGRQKVKAFVDTSEL
ncbi:DotH/IcmK family type IV secretion protein [Vibrio parahaemolyticus]|uniref:Uncharacterized protein n=6 Tax=Vibrio TaxID=662 RepID=A0AA47JMK7_VIBPH|nr:MULTISPECIES: DotH/IcmK family type IV secretion protein [Vibrio]EJG1066077.1 hypothetical protein [Vibrio parahaemolyticus O1]MDW1807400.1 DotH/IcmK family type IV secretion protein [Vibrio sp. Vb2362]MDW2296441.1 DotH/IcmK family type IV secretion protein [Vibrio sp. 1404]OOH98596.1 hypothetical protein BIW16_18935 [Vibrio sp. OULL4]APX09763.1 hypothetical protein BWP24_26490 [Vibrio campbellii]